MPEYRCTRNALYTANCAGREDLNARQGYYIDAQSEEKAWQKMAQRYPEETNAGFTVEEWESVGSVEIVQVTYDEQGNRVERSCQQGDYELN